MRPHRPQTITRYEPPPPCNDCFRRIAEFVYQRVLEGPSLAILGLGQTERRGSALAESWSAGLLVHQLRVMLLPRRLRQASARDGAARASDRGQIPPA